MSEGLPGLLLDEIGRIMHESWCVTKRAQGFHGPEEKCTTEHAIAHGVGLISGNCGKFHADLIPWEQLPEKQKDINRHAFDALLPRINELITSAQIDAFLLACMAECSDCEGGAWVYEDGGTWYHKGVGNHCFAWRTRNAAKEAGVQLPQFCDLEKSAKSADQKTP